MPAMGWGQITNYGKKARGKTPPLITAPALTNILGTGLLR